MFVCQGPWRVEERIQTRGKVCWAIGSQGSPKGVLVRPLCIINRSSIHINGGCRFLGLKRVIFFLMGEISDQRCKVTPKATRKSMSAMVRLEPMSPASQTRVLPIVSHFPFFGNPAYENKLPGSWISCLQPCRHSWSFFPKFPVPRCQIYFCLPPPAEVIPGNGSGLETDYSDPGALFSPPWTWWGGGGPGVRERGSHK